MILFDEHPHEHLRPLHLLQVSRFERGPHQRGDGVSQIDVCHCDGTTGAGEGENRGHVERVARRETVPH